MRTKKLQPTKSHRKHHSALKMPRSTGDITDNIADALNSVELKSLNTRGKSMTPDEAREITEAPKALGQVIEGFAKGMKRPTGATP
jgi:hypothetical protein